MIETHMLSFLATALKPMRTMRIAVKHTILELDMLHYIRSQPTNVYETAAANDVSCPDVKTRDATRSNLRCPHVAWLDVSSSIGW